MLLLCIPPFTIGHPGQPLSSGPFVRRSTSLWPISWHQSQACLPRSLASVARPSCVASLLHKSLSWLVVCYLVERPHTLFNPRVPQSSLARSLNRFYPSLGHSGLAPYWPRAKLRTDSEHTQAAWNSVIDSPLVRRVPISLSSLFLPRDLRLSLRLQTHSQRSRRRHAASAAHTSDPPDVILDLGDRARRSAYLASLDMDTESALRL